MLTKQEIRFIIRSKREEAYLKQAVCKMNKSDQGGKRFYEGEITAYTELLEILQDNAVISDDGLVIVEKEADDGD